jgi:uncharacterized protein YkwD
MSHTTLKIAIHTAAAAIALAGGLTLASGGTASATTLTNCEIVAGNGARVDSLAVDLRDEEVDMVKLINEFRTKNGVAPLTSSRVLDRPAAWASNDSAIRGYTPSGHVDSLGRGIGTRFNQCGVTEYNRIAEISYQRNGGDTRVSARDALTAWDNSPSHHAILLDSSLTSMGIGIAYIGEYGQPAATTRVHWTVTFSG